MGRVPSKSIMDSWLKLRQRLIDDKTLVENEGRYIFISDTIFSSPSAASSIVLGRQSSGPLEWKTEDGQSYKDVNA